MILGIQQNIETLDIETTIGSAQADQHSTRVHFSGMVPLQSEDIRDQETLNHQIRQVYDQLKDRLHAHGATLKNVIKETILSRDMDTLIRTAGIRGDVYGENGLPASTWIEVAPKGFQHKLIEVDIQAELETDPKENN